MIVIQSRIKLCSLFGIPLYLSFSLIFLFLFFIFSAGSFEAGFLLAMMLLLSITLHELGHALTARAFGYQTRDITLSLLGGCASLIALPRKSSQEFLTALAGPLVSFALAGLGIAGLTMLAEDGNACSFIWHDFLGQVDSLRTDGQRIFFMRGSTIVYTCAKANQIYVELLTYFSCLNLILGCFNLLPGFPMDGGRIFRSAMRPFMPRVKATYVAMLVGRAFAILLAGYAIMRIANGRPWGFVTLMIAWMIWREGYKEYLMARFESVWDPENFRAHASPPPYGGDSSDSDLDRGWPKH